jgi:hypothetical protein
MFIKTRRGSRGIGDGDGMGVDMEVLGCVVTVEVPNMP